MVSARVGLARIESVTVMNRTVGTSRCHQNAYSTRGEELWGGVRDRLRAKRLDFSALEPTIQDELIAQLSTRHFKPFGPKGILKLEPKDAMRSRGVRSPDLADALALACLETGSYSDIFMGDKRITSEQDWGGIEVGEERVTAHQEW